MRNVSRYMLPLVFAATSAACSQPQMTMQGGKPEANQAPKTIEETVKPCRKIEGLFTIYQDTTNGSSYLAIKKDQIGKEYIYFSYTVDGIADVGHFRGGFRDNKVFSVNKYFNRIEFVNENTEFYFDSSNAISRAKEANISRSLLAAQKIVAEDSAKGEYLIKADDLFLTESLSQIKPTPWPGSGNFFFSLGNLSREKTKYTAVRNYPKNTDVVVEYVFETPYPNSSAAGVTDSRFVSIKVQHSLIEVPQNNYVPRRDDPRIGYFSEFTEDMTSTSATPYRDFIHRWNLVKKYPDSALSEPVEPITWWIENTTPREFRSTIKAAGEAWNEAFEKAGFRNAVVIKEQPDTATWDAGDIRYNVLRWTSSPEPPFGGYGPSFVNPRTGEILGADIMLEYVFVTNRLRQEKLFDAAALNLHDPLEHLNPAKLDKHFCSATNYLHQQTMFGMTALKTYSLSDAEKSDYIKQSLYYLVLHEMGHTMGLNHNMKSSQLYSPADVHNKELTMKTGLTGSVMDYPAVNLALDKSKQGQYFTMKPGPYDMWAIEYGYSPAMANEKAEEERLQRILSRSTEPQLVFGNDADDMRAPGWGIDPRVNINDMSSDAIGYSIERMQLVNNLASKLKEKYSEPGKSYHELRNAYLSLTGEYATAAGVISRYIGGIYINRGMVGQPGADKPFTPVAYADQKRAMDALSKYLFAPDAFKTNDDIYAYLATQRRGFSTGTDPKIQDRFLNIQRSVLAHLMHPAVLKRMTDSKTYGNQYSLSEYMGDLTNAAFRDDSKGNVNTFRQNLQTEYVRRLISVLKPARSEGQMAMFFAAPGYDYSSQAVALQNLRTIQKMVTATKGGDAETAAHRERLAFEIKKALDSKD